MNFDTFLQKHYSFIYNRRSSSSFWDDECGDSKKNFLKSKCTNFKEDSITYKYNSHGFRCDEFTQTSELPILFLGCSVTEGYALPHSDCWAKILIDKIRKSTGKNIPFWNLSIAGCGIDTQANLLFNFRNNFEKPQYIFSFFPPFSRVEARMGSNEQMIFSRKFDKHLTKFFSDDNLRHGITTRSIEFFDIIAESTDFYYAGWNHTETEYDTIRKCDNLKLIFPSNSIFCDMKSFDLARDQVHPGKQFHQMLADNYWQSIKHNFENINE